MEISHKLNSAYFTSSESQISLQNLGLISFALYLRNLLGKKK